MNADTIIAKHGGPAFEHTAAMRDAAGVSALVMICLVALLCTAILLFALHLRKRSKNPTPESRLLDELASESEYRDPLPTASRGQNESARNEWERPDDWWKSTPS